MGNRKRRAKSTSDTEGAPDTDAVGPAAEDAPSLRRSARTAQQSKSVRDVQGEGAGMYPHTGKGGTGVLHNPDAKGLKDEKSIARAGVAEAIHGLQEMELRLQKANKRQKLKVEESFNQSSFELTPALLAYKNAERSTKKAEKDHLPTPEREAVDSEYEDGGAGADGAEEPDAVERGAKRSPPVNSDYLPLPWKGRLGYACLNTYLRTANPPVFSSRTCRMQSIVDHRHPLADPSQPPHPTKNRPDKAKPADVQNGRRYVQDLGLANARDIPKMLRWNDKYGIKFMRLSSEMFPFASHPEHGYELAPFASDVLREAGRVAAELGHRLTTHPGQFTQLGSPRPEVIRAAVRDLEYHDEMLSLLRLPEQQNRDAIMILHMGGTYGDKAATLGRFRENYTRLLSASIKNRLVLENDDVAWTVHDLLPICEELEIPLVLDFHHHNIMFDAAQLREGTRDIVDLFPRIAATWTRKRITQKMHYSEPCAGRVTPRDRRKHSPRVASLPPCPPDMDLMIEAKDKEQAVFELMRTFRLPGHERLNDVVPYEREDEERRPAAGKAAANRGRKRTKTRGGEAGDGGGEGAAEAEEAGEAGAGGVIRPEDFGMGGPMNRVYWPVGMEEWLRPAPRKKDGAGKKEKRVTGEVD